MAKKKRDTRPGKKTKYYETAQSSFVEHGLSLSEISKTLNVSVRTLRLWKNDNNWDNLRNDYINLKSSITGDTMVILRNVTNIILEAVKNRQEPSPTILRYHSSLISSLMKVKEFEEASTEEKEKVHDNKDMPDEIKKSINAFLKK